MLKLPCISNKLTKLCFINCLARYCGGGGELIKVCEHENFTVMAIEAFQKYLTNSFAQFLKIFMKFLKVQYFLLINQSECYIIFVSIGQYGQYCSRKL